MMDSLINSGNVNGMKLCLHSCCAPCSSYCLLYLSPYFEITVLYYNPNITEESEYRKRAAEQKRFIDELNAADGLLQRGGVLWKDDKHPEQADWIREQLTRSRYKISYIEGEYEPDAFFQMSRGLENEPERGRRCMGCYALRLKKAAEYAKNSGLDCFASTLTLSPLKDAAAINRIGAALESEYGIKYLPTDFKKKNGYLLSLMLSELFGLYRQDYCGCIYSKEQKK